MHTHLQFEMNVLGIPLLNNSFANSHLVKILASVTGMLKRDMPSNNDSSMYLIFHELDARLLLLFFLRVS